MPRACKLLWIVMSIVKVWVLLIHGHGLSFHFVMSLLYFSLVLYNYHCEILLLGAKFIPILLIIVNKNEFAFLVIYALGVHLLLFPFCLLLGLRYTLQESHLHYRNSWCLRCSLELTMSVSSSKLASNSKSCCFC